MTTLKIISTEELRRLYLYNEKTGVFTRAVNNGSRGKAGDTPGHKDKDGYLIITIYNRLYRVSRLAWFFIHGAWPKGQIDHIDGDKSNNSIVNLRDVSQQLNRQNIQRPTKRNSHGHLGIRRARNGNWQAAIGINKKTISIGTFKTPEDAHQAYLAAKRIYHQGCTV